MSTARGGSASCLATVPTLDEIAADPVKAATLPTATAQALWARCLLVLTALLPSASSSAPAGPAPLATPTEDDRYLTMQEVKERTGLSLSYLYELARAGALPVKPMG